VGRGAASRLRAPPPAWPSEAEGRTEWLQVAELLSQLLRQHPPQHPPAHPPAAAPADDRLEVLEAPQEISPQEISPQEIGAPPPQAPVSCSVGTST